MATDFSDYRSPFKAFKDTILLEKIKDEELSPVGIGAFVMYVSLNETASKTATVTNNPVESGSYLNDHIIKNPTSISIEGEVADVFVQTQPLSRTVQTTFAPIGIIQDYLPTRTQTQISKINGLVSSAEDVIDKIDLAIEKGDQLYNFYNGIDSDKPISVKFLEYFDTIFESRSIISIECIDKIFSDMAITSFTTSKINQGNYSFTITAQKIVQAETRILQLVKNASGDSTSQGGAMSDKGTQQTEEVDESLANFIKSGISWKK